MWNKIKPYMPWNVIEFIFYFILFNIANTYYIGDGSRASFAVALASCGLMMAIQTRRKLNKGEYK